MPKAVFAHVLLEDKNAEVGAVLHLTPDDDPIAGQNSQLFFDIQDKNTQARIPYSGYELLSTNESNTTTAIPLEVSGKTLTANYTFPVQGVYRLELKSKQSYDSFVKVSILYTLRVSRGKLQPGAISKKQDGANLGIIASIAATGGLIIVGFNNRREIISKSKR